MEKPTQTNSAAFSPMEVTYSVPVADKQEEEDADDLPLASAVAVNNQNHQSVEVVAPTAMPEGFEFHVDSNGQNILVSVVSAAERRKISQLSFFLSHSMS